MQTEYPSFSQGTSWYVSDTVSDITVLKPRDLRSPSDNQLSTFRAFLEHVNETWFTRVKLIFRILCFCLGPGNIWRFQRQSLIHGNATFIYLYSIFTLLFGTSLLVFEINLSQYFVKGFAKLFTISPIMEGITLSMTLYCIMANLVFSLICVYFITYMISSFHTILPYSTCSQYLAHLKCDDNTTHISASPAYLYFFDHTEHLEVIHGDNLNWKNSCIVLCIWFVVGSAILFVVLKYKWLGSVLSLCILLVLIYTSIISASIEGASIGLRTMFVPRKEDISKLTSWVNSLEETLVTMGVGAGPLTTVWSRTKIKQWSHLDCFIVNILAFICTILSGIIFYSAAGAAAHKYNVTVLQLMNEADPEINSFILISDMLTNLKSGVSHFTLFIYYFVLTGSGFYALLEYTTIIFIYISSYRTIKEERTKLVISTCMVLCMASVVLGITKFGYFFIMSVNEMFIGNSQVFILCCELMATIWFYGLTDFCDDIEFMLGFAPSCYFKIVWCSFPVVLLVFGICALCLNIANCVTVYDKLSVTLTFLFTIVPILAFAIYKSFTARKYLGWKGIINPRLHKSETPSASQFESISLSSRLSRDTFSNPALKM